MALNEAWMLMVKGDLRVDNRKRGNHRRRQMHSPCQSFPQSAMMEYKIRQRRLIDLVTTILKRKKAKQSGRMI